MIGQSILFFLFSENQDISILENNKKKINFIKKTYPKVKIVNSLNKNFYNYFDYIYETTGVNKVIEKSFKSIKLSGKLLLIGVPNHNHKIKINTLEINYGKKIIGSYGGGVIPNKDIKKIIFYLSKRKAKYKNLYDKIYNFKNLNSVIRKLILGKIIKKPIIKLY